MFTHRLRGSWLCCCLTAGLFGMTAADGPDLRRADQLAEMQVGELGSGLELLVQARADFSGHGSVTLLNNGWIVVRTGGDQHRDDLDRLVIEPLETVLLATRQSYETSDALRSILTLDDAAFDIVWEMGADRGVLTVSNGELLTQLEFCEADFASATSCAATCPSGTSCSVTCPDGKACLSYCDGATPHCDCIAPPKREVNLPLD